VKTPRWSAFRPPDDPGGRWADTLLSDLRDETLDIDVTGRVMHRLASLRPAPAPLPLPGRWPGVAWAASLALGCVCLVLLTATLLAMVLGGDDGARAAWAVVTSAGQAAWAVFARVWSMAGAFLSASLAMLRGALIVIDGLAPLVRGAGALAALAGVLSIAVSICIFEHARRGAPIAARRPIEPIHGGLT
jgi:hypothetical protein